MIGEDERHRVRARHLGPPDTRLGPVGADHQPRVQRAFLGRRLVTIDHRDVALCPLDPQERADLVIRARLDRAVAQERIEILAVDHADEPVLDRDIDLPPGGGDHPRGVNLGQKLRVTDVEVFHQARRNRAATGLDPPLPVKQHDGMTGPCKILGGGRTRRASAHDDDVIHCYSPGTRVAVEIGVAARITRAAMIAASRNSAASIVKTVP